MDAEKAGGRSLYRLFDRFPTREHAEECRAQMLQSEAATPIDSMEAFTAACALAQEAGSRPLSRRAERAMRRERKRLKKVMRFLKESADEDRPSGYLVGVMQGAIDALNWVLDPTGETVMPSLRMGMAAAKTMGCPLTEIPGMEDFRELEEGMAE